MPLKCRKTPTRRIGRAFTLIELLTVIAIVGILAALTIVSLSRAKYTARNIRCLNNFRQFGVAVMLYANDHRNSPPGPFSTDQQSCEAVAPTGQLAMAMTPYLETYVPSNGNPRVIPIFVCPVWEAASGRYARGYDSPDNSYSSMILRINTKLFGGGGANFPHVTSLYSLPTVSGSPGTPGNTFLIRDNTFPTSTYAPKLPQNGKWHGNNNNVVYLDGHVATEISP